MPNHYSRERALLLAAVKEMALLGLVSGSSGNASMRLPLEHGLERFLITPASKDYSKLAADGLVAVNSEIEPVDGDGVPSTESLLHLAIYRARPDIGAVMHTHSVYATALAVAGRPIPPVMDEMVVYLGGGVEVANYGFPGSEELATEAVKALGNRRAVLLRNHGLCGAGASPDGALQACVLAERAAHVFLLAEAAGGATLLPTDAVEAERGAYLMRSGLKD